jgi:hypothetical protein
MDASDYIELMDLLKEHERTVLLKEGVKIRHKFPNEEVKQRVLKLEEKLRKNLL